jgi:1-deoxyxylulose-5-phosphate synthase
MTVPIINFGRSGLKVSRICLGAMAFGSPKWHEWVLDEAASRPIIKLALDLGINFFDTADRYSFGASESVLGRALNDFGPSREQIVVGTKVFGAMGSGPNEAGLSRKHIMHAIDASLRRLGMDYVDLYQVHRFDPLTPIEETVDAMNDVVRAGKARYIGASSMAAWQFCQYLYKARAAGCCTFVSMQNHYNLVYREEEREMLPLCKDEGIAVIPWSPLAGGFLARNRLRSPDEASLRGKTDKTGQSLYGADCDFDVLEKVTEIAGTRGISNAQVALSWLLRQPGVTSPIIGASKPCHLHDAVAALGVTLSEDEVECLQAAYRPHTVLGHS